MSPPRRFQVRRKAVPHHPGVYCRPRPDGKVVPPYEIRYFDSSGQQRWETIYGSLREAEARRAELRLRQWRGERLGPAERFDEYARAWLDRQEVRPRTHEGYRWALDRHVIPYFGERRLDQISCDDIAAFISAKRAEGLKGWTVTSILRPLSIILAQAARRGAIHVNPLHQLEPRERPRHDDQRPKRILTLEEMRSLLAHADSDSYRALLALLLTSGLRIGEALGLVVADLDPAYSVISVECQLGRDGFRAPLKTEESQRAIDIPVEVMCQVLAQVTARGTTSDSQALVFASRTGTGLQRKVAREALQRAAKGAKLVAPHPTLHDLRHTHASMLIALDASIVDVQRRLGHRKPDTTLRAYAHEWRYREAQRSKIGSHLPCLLPRILQDQMSAIENALVPGKETVVQQRGANWSFHLPHMHRIEINREHQQVTLSTPQDGSTMSSPGSRK